MENAAMTHKELVRRAALWLRNNQRCSVVLVERSTRVSETPDSLGFVNGSLSILVECKASRSDFLADKAKFFRRFEDMGVGDKRYFLAPPGVVREHDDLNGWGLLICSAHQVQEAKPPAIKRGNKHNEVAMLVSAMRRLEIAATVFVRTDEPPAAEEGK